MFSSKLRTWRFDMISNELTFSKLKSLLMDLGFSEVITREGSHTVFKNPTSDSIIVLPPLSPQQLVSPRHIAAVRRILIENNLLDQNQLTPLISQPSLC
jgi:predicted RNA binding protein YcfA (HicA-like mRNA interferase family)